MRVQQALSLADLQRMARRRLPRVVYDYIESGTDDELLLERNEAAFRQHALVPRYLVDVSAPDLSTELFGRRCSLPFGFAPTGTVGLFRPGGDLMLAEAAAAANIPYVMSGASNALLEDAARRDPAMWYQLYASRDEAITADLVARAEAAGCAALVLTVDVPVFPKRERNQRNGFSHRMTLTPRLVWDGLTHPAWLAGYLRHGVPAFENWIRYAPAETSARDLVDFFWKQTHSAQTWRNVERLRQLWPRALVTKGVLHPDDARMAVELGVDGIIVSNHGGRQFDRAPTAVEVLPAVADAVGERATVMIDGGIRRGSDVVTALCLGARFVFIGRPAVYGVAAAGSAGLERVIAILQGELANVMCQMGRPTIDELGRHSLLSEVLAGLPNDVKQAP